MQRGQDAHVSHKNIINRVLNLPGVEWFSWLASFISKFTFTTTHLERADFAVIGVKTLTTGTHFLTKVS